MIMDPEVRKPQGEQEGTDDPEEILFPDDNDKDRIEEFSPTERFYRFNEEIGSGAYKTVYRGHDSDTGREIAWNVIKLDNLPPTERKRLTEEIYILKNISHKKIITFINAWLNKAKNKMIFITEMVSGGSLKKHLRKIRKPRLKVIKGWCREILEGLNYLHTQKPSPIIHRDIKCENIFINTNTNEIRIGDLGLAIFTRDNYAETLIGTPEFMAPEIIECSRYSTGVDVYAFGMCVLEMATLQTPYQECKSQPQIYKMIEQRIKPKSLDLIELDSLRSFISKCLADANDRPSAAELLEDDFFLPDEEDKKEIKLKEMSVIAEVSRDMEDTLKGGRGVMGLMGGWDADEIGSLKDSRNNASSLSNNMLAASADLNVKKQQPNKNALKRMPSYSPLGEALGDSPQNLQKIKILVSSEFKTMYQNYRRKILPQIEPQIIGSINQFEQELLSQLQQSSKDLSAPDRAEASEAADQPNSQSIRVNKSRKMSTDKGVLQTNTCTFETKSMVQVNQNSTKNTSHKWNHNDLVFPSHQSQTRPPPAYADYSQGKIKVMIPSCTTPQPQTSNAIKLAEIANKFKPPSEEPGKVKSQQSIKGDTVPGAIIRAPSDPMVAQLDKQQSPQETNKQMSKRVISGELAKKEANKSSPTSTDINSIVENKLAELKKAPILPPTQKSVPAAETIYIDPRSILTNLRPKPNLPPQPQQPPSATFKSAAVHTLIPGMQSSAPTSPSPHIGGIMGSTPTSPPPNIQTHEILINTARQLTHPQTTGQPQTPVPAIQPFSQTPTSLPLPDAQSFGYSKSESVRTAPDTVEMLASSATPKEDPQSLFPRQSLQRSRTEEFSAESLLLSQAKRKVREIRFPISKESNSKEDVIQIQNMLSRLLEQKIETSGVFGHYTEELVKQFQEKHRLPRDGMIDFNVYSAMLQEFEELVERAGRLDDKEKQLKVEKEQKREQTNEESQKRIKEIENEIYKM